MLWFTTEILYEIHMPCFALHCVLVCCKRYACTDRRTVTLLPTYTWSQDVLCEPEYCCAICPEFA